MIYRIAAYLIICLLFITSETRNGYRSHFRQYRRLRQ